MQDDQVTSSPGKPWSFNWSFNWSSSVILDAGEFTGDFSAYLDVQMYLAVRNGRT